MQRNVILSVLIGVLIGFALFALLGASGPQEVVAAESAAKMELDPKTGLPVGAVKFEMDGMSCLAMPDGSFDCFCPCETGACQAPVVVTETQVVTVPVVATQTVTVTVPVTSSVPTVPEDEPDDTPDSIPEPEPQPEPTPDPVPTPEPTPEPVPDEDEPKGNNGHGNNARLHVHYRRLAHVGPATEIPHAGFLSAGGARERPVRAQ